MNDLFLDYLFNKLISWENLLLAFKKANKGRRWRAEILGFTRHIVYNLVLIREALLKRTYVHSDYFIFIINDSKKRIIRAAPFRDRIVHHALCNILEPIFEKSFIFDSYACRKGKGSHKAIKRLQCFLRVLDRFNDKKIFCLKCDITKFFDNIDHNVLKQIIRTKISSPGVLWLTDLIIDSYGENTGNPIGNLTSQLFANIYLNELDHFIKDRLQVKYYIRYMDDFIILDTDKHRLFELRNLIKDFLQSKLKLQLHPKKSEYFPINKGVDFLGYIVFPNYILLRKSTVQRFLKKCKKQLKKCLTSKEQQELLNIKFQSWYSYYHYAQCWRLIKNYKKIY